MLSSVMVSFILFFNRDAVAYGESERSYISQGSYVELCVDNGKIMEYDISHKVITALMPCDEKPLFSDGFE